MSEESRLREEMCSLAASLHSRAQVTKDEKGNITERVVCGVRYVPLTDRESQVRGRM